MYTKESIINSSVSTTDIVKDATGAYVDAPKFIAKPGVFTVLRDGEYKKEHLKDNRIYKTAGYAGSRGSVEILLNGTGLGGTVFTQAGTYRISILLKMLNRINVEMANANWYLPGRPIMAEFEVTTAVTLAGIKAKIAKLFNEIIPFNNKYAYVSETANGIQLVILDKYTSTHWAGIEYYDPSPYEISYVPVAATVNVVKNVEPFATGQWLIENLRLPTDANVRYASSQSDEWPIASDLYTQYTFAYRVNDRKDLRNNGLSAVGQVLSSETNHIFYVRNTAVADFEKAIDEAFGSNVIVENKSVAITSAPTIANDDIPVRLVADTYPIDDTAVITWSGTPPANVTLTSTGVLTASTTAVVGAEFEVTAKSSNLDYKEAKMKIKVIKG